MGKKIKGRRHARRKIARTPRIVKRPRTTDEAKAFAENVKALQLQKSQRTDFGHVATPHYHRTPAAPIVTAPPHDPNLIALKDEVRGLRQQLESQRVVDSSSSSDDEDPYTPMEVESRVEKAKLPERVSKTFTGAVDPQTDQPRPITIDWDRGGDIGIQIANGNMQRGKNWPDVKERLREARIRDQEINDLEFQFNNRKAHTAGRSKGYDIVDEFGKKTVVKAYPGEKFTIKDEAGKVALTGNTAIPETAKRMRMLGVKPKKIQAVLSDYATKKHEDQDAVRNVMSDLGRQMLHRTKIESQDGQTEAVVAGDVVRVGKRNAATDKWEYKSFHKDDRNAEAGLKGWLGNDEAKTIWKKWYDVRNKVATNAPAEVTKPTSTNWRIFGGSSEQQLKDRKYYLKHMSGRSEKESEELRNIEEYLKPTKKVNPNAPTIKQETKSVQPVGPEFKPGETLAQVQNLGGKDYLIGTHGTMREVPDTRGLLGKAGGAALDLGKSALQVGSNFIQGPTGSRLLRNMALNGLDHFNPGEDSKFRYLKKAADLTDFSKVLREQIGDENAVLQHQRALESYKREAEMSAAKYDAHKARRQRMEKEADEIVSAREETRKRIEERLQQMETQIKDGKLKKAEALKAIGTVFGSAAKWALKIGGAAAGVVVGAGGTAASLGTATPAAAAAGASLALLLNTLGDAAGEFFPNVASAAKDWVTNLPEKEREAIEKLRQHQLEPDPTRGQIYRKLRSEAKERKHKKKTATS